MINGEVSFDSHILVSSTESSHILHIQNGSAIRFNSGMLNALITDQPTLAFSNVYKRRDRSYVNSPLVVQVVPTSVQLLEWDSALKCYVERSKWDPVPTDGRAQSRPQIVLATSNCSQIALTLGGGSVVLLRLVENAAAIEQQLVSFTLKRSVDRYIFAEPMHNLDLRFRPYHYLL